GDPLEQRRVAPMRAINDRRDFDAFSCSREQLVGVFFQSGELVGVERGLMPHQITVLLKVTEFLGGEFVVHKFPTFKIRGGSRRGQSTTCGMPGYKSKRLSASNSSPSRSRQTAQTNVGLSKIARPASWRIFICGFAQSSSLNRGRNSRLRASTWPSLVN